jgi:hypothetical protein
MEQFKTRISRDKAAAYGRELRRSLSTANYKKPEPHARSQETELREPKAVDSAPGIPSKSDKEFPKIG